MKFRLLSAVFTVTFGLFAFSGASAQDMSCDDIVFTGDIAARFPNAKDACRGVVDRDGKPYAHFVAELRRTRESAVFVKFERPDGSMSRTFTFTPPSNARVDINGRSMRYNQLVAGQKFDVWIPHDSWEVAVHESPEEFAAAPEVVTVAILVVEEEEEMPARLPSTASPLPLVGLLGGLFVMLGAGVAWIRRRAGSS